MIDRQAGSLRTWQGEPSDTVDLGRRSLETDIWIRLLIQTRNSAVPVFCLLFSGPLVSNSLSPSGCLAVI